MIRHNNENDIEMLNDRRKPRNEPRNHDEKTINTTKNAKNADVQREKRRMSWEMTKRNDDLPFPCD